jgi:lipopolysaccharide/colanic/teichoic acid biosynthesis glycosyltransferase
MKRLADIVAACVFLPVPLPLFPVLALQIKIDSPGPVFYSQMRIGRKMSRSGPGRSARTRS